ncbi:hypothetical protein R3P38DRAFT_759012 [Favolaschia claudopus]|uniref:Secreted protein n=1 Tax=Favolaschia claudopus TaxID=2862362 RepID=A0AAV9Z3B8_9AGAR
MDKARHVSSSVLLYSLPILAMLAVLTMPSLIGGTYRRGKFVATRKNWRRRPMTQSCLAHSFDVGRGGHRHILRLESVTRPSFLTELGGDPLHGN